MGKQKLTYPTSRWQNVEQGDGDIVIRESLLRGTKYKKVCKVIDESDTEEEREVERPVGLNRMNHDLLHKYHKRKRH